MNQSTKNIQELSKKITIDNFYYRKVDNAIWGEIVNTYVYMNMYIFLTQIYFCTPEIFKTNV